jgi:hypothetical protein
VRPGRAIAARREPGQRCAQHLGPPRIAGQLADPLDQLLEPRRRERAVEPAGQPQRARPEHARCRARRGAGDQRAAARKHQRLAAPALELLELVAGLGELVLERRDPRLIRVAIVAVAHPRAA